MVLLDVGGRGVPPGAVRAHLAARGRRPGAPTAGGTDGPATGAGHGGLDPRGAAMPQADAGRRRAEDVGTGPNTCRAGGGALVAAASAPPTTAGRQGAGEGGEHVPLLVRAAPAGAAVARVADAGTGPISADAAGGSQRRGARAVRGGTGRVHRAAQEAGGHTGAAGGPGASAGVAILAAGRVGNQARCSVPMAQGGGVLTAGGVYCAAGWNPHGQRPRDGRAGPRGVGAHQPQVRGRAGTLPRCLRGEVRAPAVSRTHVGQAADEAVSQATPHGHAPIGHGPGRVEPAGPAGAPGQGAELAGPAPHAD